MAKGYNLGNILCQLALALSFRLRLRRLDNNIRAAASNPNGGSSQLSRHVHPASISRRFISPLTRSSSSDFDPELSMTMSA